jgi:hypothetical protein
MNANAKLERDRKILIEACQMAMRKHGFGDMDIGWEQLSGILHGTLVEVMGDEEYLKWMNEVAPEKT